MVDAIIEYIRMVKTGVSSIELAERFLKFKNPPAKFAQAAICGIIAGDRRCIQNANDLWIIDESRDDSDIALVKMPLCIVYILTVPKSEEIAYVSVWDVLPYPQCCLDAWLQDPSIALPGVDLSGADFTAAGVETKLAQLIAFLSEKVPVLLSSDDLQLFNEQFENDVITDTNRVVLFDELLEALSIDIPDNYSLSQVSKLFNDLQFPHAPSEQAKLFAYIVGDVLKMANEKEIFTKKELDLAVMLTTEQMIAGKQFTIQQIKDLPAAPGVYGLKDSAGKYLFISKCKDLQQSVRSQFRKSCSTTKKRIAEETVSFDAHPCGSALECDLFEYRLIKKYNPRFHANREIRTCEIPGNGVLFLPHTDQSKVLTIWICEKRNILMKSYQSDSDIQSSLEAELGSYFFTKPDCDQSDQYERGLVGSYLKKNPDCHLLKVTSQGTIADLINAFNDRIRNFVEN